MKQNRVSQLQTYHLQKRDSVFVYEILLLPRDNTRGHFYSLQFRISIAVYQRIQLLSLLTEWTLAKIKCLIIRKFPFGVNTVNRNPVHLIHSCKNGRNPLQYTAVILNTFHSLCNGFPVVTTARRRRIFFPLIIGCRLSRKII